MMKNVKNLVSRNGSHYFIIFIAVTMFAFVYTGTAYGVSAKNIVELSQAGLDESTIIQKVKNEGLDSPLSVDEIIMLKKSGFSGNAIKQFIVMETGTSTNRTSSTVRNTTYANPVRNETRVSIGTNPNSYNMLDLTVVNQHNRSLSISLDNNSRRLYCSFGSNYSSNSISPNGSATFRVTPGTYSIIAQGYNRTCTTGATYSMNLQPGNASMFVTARYDQYDPFNFMINQNGQSYYATSYTNYNEPVIVTSTPVIIDYNYSRKRHSKNHCRKKYHKHYRNHNRHYCPICRRYYTGTHRCSGSYLNYTKFGKHSIFSIGLSNQ